MLRTKFNSASKQMSISILSVEIITGKIVWSNFKLPHKLLKFKEDEKKTTSSINKIKEK